MQVTEAPETPEQMEARLTKKLEARLTEEITKKLEAAGGASAAVSVSVTHTVLLISVWHSHTVLLTLYATHTVLLTFS